MNGLLVDNILWMTFLLCTLCKYSEEYNIDQKTFVQLDNGTVERLRRQAEKQSSIGKQCTTPGQPSHGRWIYLNSGKEGAANVKTDTKTVILYLCDPGFKLSVTNEDILPLICQSTGEWSNPVPTCQDTKYLSIIFEDHFETILNPNKEDHLDVTNHKNYRLLPEECGFLDAGNRIINGVNTLLNKFPWMALLQYETARGLCGGTIINYNYILTAAHCLVSKPVSVRVGEYSINNVTDCVVQDDREATLKCNPPVQDLEVEEIIPHPQFLNNGTHILNNIGLLRVSRIKKDENVYPVCLPVGELRDWLYQKVIVTGWGTDSQTQLRSDILKRLVLPVVDKQTCANTYKDQGIEFIESLICAGGEQGEGPCSGDSGGPMLVPAYTVRNPNLIYVQHGIISFGPKLCGLSGFPPVYTLVKYYMPWILDTMKPGDLENTQFIDIY